MCDIQTIIAFTSTVNPQMISSIRTKWCFTYEPIVYIACLIARASNTHMCSCSCSCCTFVVHTYIIYIVHTKSNVLNALLSPYIRLSPNISRFIHTYIFIYEDWSETKRKEKTKNLRTQARAADRMHIVNRKERKKEKETASLICNSICSSSTNSSDDDDGGGGCKGNKHIKHIARQPTKAHKSLQ